MVCFYKIIVAATCIIKTVMSVRIMGLNFFIHIFQNEITLDVSVICVYYVRRVIDLNSDFIPNILLIAHVFLLLYNLNSM